MTPERGTSTLTLPSRTSSAPLLLALGVMAAGLLFTLQHGRHDATPVPAAATQAPLRLVQTAKRLSYSGPSDFEKELLMSNQELIARWDPLIVEAAKRFGVPAEWVRAVMRQESGGRTMLGETQPMLSSAGAMGIMQVMPQTYQEMRQQYHLGTDPYDPHDNVIAGVAYLSWLHGKYGYPAMFAAYNDGPGDLEAYLQSGRPLPAETVNYVRSIGRMLKDPAAEMPASKPATLTRPDGTRVNIDVAQVTGVHAAVPGEYGPDVQSVISLGRVRQGVREDVAAATMLLRKHGARV